MSPRSIIIVLLAMCGSFTTILAVLGYVVGPGVLTGTKQRQRPKSVALQPPTPVSPVRSLARDTFTRDSAKRLQDIPDAPDQAQPLSNIPVQLPPPGEKPDRTDGGPNPEIQRLARVTERRLQGVESALSQQVRALKESRDQMLDEFAGQLASMPVAEASETMSPLDNETAALTLNRLGKARRNAILRTLAPKKRATLEKLIRKKR